MAEAAEIFPRPQNFPYQNVMYSDHNIAMIYGRYKNAEHECLGLRWTQAESPLGYPNIFGNGMWMVVPDKLAVHILNGIREDPRERANGHILDEDEFQRAWREINTRHLS